MTRGNQRDVDRERARKRLEREAPSQKKGDFNQRRERDAEIMRQKQLKNQAKPEQQRSTQK